METGSVLNVNIRTQNKKIAIIKLAPGIKRNHKRLYFVRFQFVYGPGFFSLYNEKKYFQTFARFCNNYVSQKRTSFFHIINPSHATFPWCLSPCNSKISVDFSLRNWWSKNPWIWLVEIRFFRTIRFFQTCYFRRIIKNITIHQFKVKKTQQSHKWEKSQYWNSDLTLKALEIHVKF